MTVDLIILGTAVLVVVPSAVLGCFLVLRRAAMTADAIAHAALPGIVLAFFLTGSLGPLTAVAGAAVLGLVTVLLIDLLRRGSVRSDAATGIVFTALFALGVLLIARYGGNVHLDVEHVLYGEIVFTPLHVLSIGPVTLPRAWWTTGLVAVIALTFVALLYKELKAATFDPGLAAVLGISPVLVHQLLMAVVSVTVVGAFDAVGAILVIAFIAGPPATAYLLTERLAPMIGAAVATGILAAFGGYALAVAGDLSVAGSMATAVGVLFVLAVLFAPRHSVLAAVRQQRRAHRRLRRRIVTQARSRLGAQATTAQLAGHLGWSERQVRRAGAPVG